MLELLPAPTKINSVQSIADECVARLAHELPKWQEALAGMRFMFSRYADYRMGFEFEFLSSVSRDRVADALTEALRSVTVPPAAHREKSPFRVIAYDGYHAIQRDMNTWIVESDSSIRCTSQFDVAVELVTPPLTAEECVTYVPLILALIRTVGTVNDSCGLHFTVGHPKIGPNLDVLALFGSFDQVGTLSHFGRSTNGYCAPVDLHPSGLDQTDLHSYLMAQTSAGAFVPQVNTKYRAINLGKLSRGLIELRAMGGTQAAQISSLVFNTAFSFLEAVRMAVENDCKQRSRSYRKFQHTHGIVLKKDGPGSRYRLGVDSVSYTTYPIPRHVASDYLDLGALSENDALARTLPDGIQINANAYLFAASLEVSTVPFHIRLNAGPQGDLVFVVGLTAGYTPPSVILLYRAFVSLSRVLPLLSRVPCRVVPASSLIRYIEEMPTQCSSNSIAEGLDRLSIDPFATQYVSSCRVLSRTPTTIAGNRPISLSLRRSIGCVRTGLVPYAPKHIPMAEVDPRHDTNKVFSALSLALCQSSCSIASAIEDVLGVVNTRTNNSPFSLREINLVSVRAGSSLSFVQVTALLVLAAYQRSAPTRVPELPSNASSIIRILSGLPAIIDGIIELEKEYEHPITATDSVIATILDILHHQAGCASNPALVEKLRDTLDHLLSRVPSVILSARTYTRLSEVLGSLFSKSGSLNSALNPETDKHRIEYLLTLFCSGSGTHTPDLIRVNSRFLRTDNEGPFITGFMAPVVGDWVDGHVKNYLETGDIVSFRILCSVASMSYNHDECSAATSLSVYLLRHVRIGLTGTLYSALRVARLIRGGDLSESIASSRSRSLILWLYSQFKLTSNRTWYKSAREALPRWIRTRKFSNSLLLYMQARSCYYGSTRVPPERIHALLSL